MSAFARLKANRQADTAKLQDLVKNGGKKVYEEDTRYWQPEVDKKTGLGGATIRFMPTSETDDAPFVTIYEHAFQRVGGWYIEKSRTSIGPDEKDPVIEMNDKLWKSGPAGQAEVKGVEGGAKGSKRNKYYISNIYVVKHDARPEDEGKVFLFKYGQKIKNKIDELLIPEDAGEDVIDVTDLWEGSNFSLKITRQGQYRNYDTSKFLKQSQLLSTDEALEAVYTKLYPLKAEIAEDKFKSYEQLSDRLTRVMGGVSQAAQARNAKVDADEDDTEGYAGRTETPRNARSNVREDDTDNSFFNRASTADLDDDIPF